MTEDPHETRAVPRPARGLHPVRARIPALPDDRETPFLAELRALAESLPDDGRQVFVWSHATGWQDAEGNAATSTSGTEFGPPDPQTVPQQILDLPENIVAVLGDFGYYLQHKTYSYADIVIAWLTEVRDVLAASERTCPAYIIMTANDVSKLPPEFTRKGRIDEIFGVYLPTAGERQEIFTIHLRLRKRDPAKFDLEALAAATESYTGADIEQVVITGLKLAFHAGTELSTEHLLQAVPEVRPLSQTDPERVAAMTKRLESHTKPAGNGHGLTQPLSGNALKRRVTV